MGEIREIMRAADALNRISEERLADVWELYLAVTRLEQVHGVTLGDIESLDALAESLGISVDAMLDGALGLEFE